MKRILGINSIIGSLKYYDWFCVGWFSCNAFL